MRFTFARATLLACALTTLPASAAEVRLLSSIPANQAPGTASGTSWVNSLSADGRWAAFQSEAPNLVPGVVDANGDFDVFLHDRVTGKTILVSHSADDDSRAANRLSTVPVLSADGRYVAFTSTASDLVPGQDDLGGFDVFLYDRVTGATELVSHRPRVRAQAAGGINPVISADGRWVAFVSSSSNLVTGQPADSFQDVYLWERRTGEVRLVSRTPASPSRGGKGTSDYPSLSADGRYVAFNSTAPDLVQGQAETGTSQNAFLHDRVTGKTVLIDHAASSATTPGSSIAYIRPKISADGRFVVYTSASNNLVPGQSGSARSIFLYERATGKNTLVSRSFSSPTAVANGLSDFGLPNADGSFVIFSSFASNLVAGQPANPGTPFGVYLYARATGRVTLLSGAGGSATVNGHDNSWTVGISADGGTVLFESLATDLVPGVTDANGVMDLYVWERRTGKAALASYSAPNALAAAAGGKPGTLGALLSNNGQWIAFSTFATDLVPGARDTNADRDIALQGRVGARTLLTRRDPARPARSPNGESILGSLSADGRYSVLTSTAPELVPGRRDTNGALDVFLADRVAGTLTLVSRSAASPGTPAAGRARNPKISADGRFVAYESVASNVVPGQVDTESSPDVFLWDRATGETILVSRAATSPLLAGGGFEPSINADGSVVAFESSAANLVPGQDDENRDYDVFVWDRATGATTLASRIAGTVATAADFSSSFHPTLSADGRFVAFNSSAPDLVGGVTDTNNRHDVFVFDRVAGITTLASRTAASPSAAAGGESPRISADGRFVAFASFGDDLVAGQTAPASPATQRLNLFLWDRTTGVTRLVSHTSGDPAREAGALQDFGDLSADGRYVVFAASASDVAGRDDNNRVDVFLYDRETGENALVSRASGAPRAASAGGFQPKISGDGRFVAFLSASADLLPGGEGSIPVNLFRYDRQSGSVLLASRAPDGGPANHLVFNLAISADGAVIAFSSEASNLVNGDFNRGDDGPLADAFAAVLP